MRALNFKQLHNMLSCTGDKKLNEVRLCLEGICAWPTRFTMVFIHVTGCTLSANQDPIGTIMGPGFASTGMSILSYISISEPSYSIPVLA